MRIIDKRTDFYDYLQNVYYDNSITFDRTDSFLLTKEIICDHLYMATTHWNDRNPYRFVLLQVCNTFWLFLFKITSRRNEVFKSNFPTNYEADLLVSWQNYDKPRFLIKLDIIDFNYSVARQIRGKSSLWEYDKNSIMKRKQDLMDAVDNNDFQIIRSINKHTIIHGDNVQTEKHIPLLMASGMSQHISPLNIYLSFEEYFSLEKQSQERTESTGLTDSEKIGNHGFDTKKSFRGKNI